MPLLAIEKAALVLGCFHAGPPTPSNWNLEMLAFCVHVGRKTGETRVNPRRREPTRNSTHIHRARIEFTGQHLLAWVSGFSYFSLPSCRERHHFQVTIGGRRALSSLCHLFSFVFSVMLNCRDRKSKSVCSTGVHITVIIDLFRLCILFSQYRSCDDTQEIWSFVLFIKKSTCKQEYVCKTKDQIFWVSSHDLYWENKMYKRKRSIRLDWIRIYN